MKKYKAPASVILSDPPVILSEAKNLEAKNPFLWEVLCQSTTLPVIYEEDEVW
ncbi:MAG: hypothetical protein J5640_01800 [Bacteroidales bacterium]|nr:hypothetical protein [Bacteroidales bacterium]